MPTAPFSSDFVAALTDQIGRLITSLPARMTTHRGADLRHALQRALYFQFANDDALRVAWLGGALGDDWLADRLARHGLMKRARTLALIAPRMARDAMLGRRARASAPIGGSLEGMLVASVIHAKFVRYVEALGLPRALYRYYCGTLAPLHDELGRYGLAALLAPSLDWWRRAIDWRQPYLDAYGLQRELDAHLAFLEATRPRAVVVVEGNSPSDEVMNQACKLTGIPCICLQQGWSPILHAGFRDFSFTKMLVWGDGFARLLAPANPRQRFVTTGSHVIGGPTAAGAFVGERSAVSFLLQGRSPMIDDVSLEGLITLVQRVAAGDRRRPVLVREHPSAPLATSTRRSLNAHPNVTIVDPANLSLQQQLAGSRVGVSLFSTTLFECVAGAVVPVAVNPGILRELRPSLAAAGVGVEVASWEAAHAAIARLCDDDTFYRQHLARRDEFVALFFHGADCDRAKRAIADELLAT